MSGIRLLSGIRKGRANILGVGVLRLKENNDKQHNHAKAKEGLLYRVWCILGNDLPSMKRYTVNTTIIKLVFLSVYLPD